MLKKINENRLGQSRIIEVQEPIQISYNSLENKDINLLDPNSTLVCKKCKKEVLRNRIIQHLHYDCYVKCMKCFKNIKQNCIKRHLAEQCPNNKKFCPSCKRWLSISLIKLHINHPEKYCHKLKTNRNFNKMQQINFVSAINPMFFYNKQLIQPNYYYFNKQYKSIEKEVLNKNIRDKKNEFYTAVSSKLHDDENDFDDFDKNNQSYLNFDFHEYKKAVDNEFDESEYNDDYYKNENPLKSKTPQKLVDFSSKEKSQSDEQNEDWGFNMDNMDY